MTERRQAYRREPIEVDLGGEVILVGPISWLKRNDFGNEVMRQNTEIMNEALQIYVNEDAENAVPHLTAKFSEKFTDPYALFDLGLDEETSKQVKAVDPLYENQIVEILLAICDVNRLETLKPLLDPNFQTPASNGGLTEMAGVRDILKTGSGPDSSSQVSTETPSDSSPILSSTPS